MFQRASEGEAIRRRAPRASAVWLSALALFVGTALRAEEPEPSMTLVELATRLGEEAKKLESLISSRAAADWNAADDKCTTDTDEPTCRNEIATAWSSTATQAIDDLLKEQEKVIRASRGDDAEGLARLSSLASRRSDQIRGAAKATARELADALEVPAAGGSWITDAIAGSSAARIAADVRAAAEEADKSILRAYPAPPGATTDAIYAELAKTRERLVGAAEKSFSRSVTCTWSPTPLEEAGTRLTCEASGLLLSGEEVSDILIQGLPLGKQAEVVALIPEQRAVANQHLARLAVGAEKDSREYSAGEVLERLDVDRRIFTVNETVPAVIEVHTDRRLDPTHGGGSRLFGGGAAYWAGVAKRLRDPAGRRLTLVSKGQGARLFVAVFVEGTDRPDVVAIPVGYARWKFEAGGFFGGSSVVDQDVTHHPDPADPSRVIVDGVEPSDKYAFETGVLLNFVPQNYQAFGVALGFATNEGRAPSVYVGANLRVRTFGQNGLASLGAGLLFKSVTRFPGISSGDSLAADSAALAGKDQFRIGLAVMLNLGFSFGPISGPKDASN